MKLPNTKTELIELLRENKAIPFHANICESCHLVPEQEAWYDEMDSKYMTVFATSKRLGSFAKWEPIYISDNQVPFYDERLSWEGESEKRLQVSYLHYLLFAVSNFLSLISFKKSFLLYFWKYLC